MSVETIMAEVEKLPLEDMQRLQTAVETATRNRYVLVHAEEQVDSLNRQVSEEMGRELGDPWTAPTGAVDAYAIGAVVEHNGAQWRSLIPGNVWEPGVSGWREIAADEAVPPAYVPPTGSHDAYQKDDRVSWDGSIWRSRIDGNVWTPQAHPQGWVKEMRIPEGMEPVEPEPTEPVEPEEPTYPEWTAPTGEHDAYGIGDVVTFEGTAYRSVIDANTWSPADYPAGWEEI